MGSVWALELHELFSSRFVCCFLVFIIIYTFLEFGVAEEEVVAASCRRALAAVWSEHAVQLVLHLVDLVEDGEHAFLEQLVSLLITEVELALQVVHRRVLQ